ncbi:fatty-acid-binding protein 1-like protein [Tanacetum coccineum]
MITNRRSSDSHIHKHGETEILEEKLQNEKMLVEVERRTGIYVDNEKLTGVLRSKIVNASTKATNEMYKMVIDNPKAIAELGGGKNNELTKRMMGEAKDDLKLTRGSEIEITCLPGCILETKVHGKVVNRLESEMLCRACIYLYLGDDPLDKEAKEKFGMFMLSLIGDRH